MLDQIEVRRMVEPEAAALAAKRATATGVEAMERVVKGMAVGIGRGRSVVDEVDHIQELSRSTMDP